MSTGTSLSLLEAATQVGRSKPTILRAIQAGKISASRDEHTGEWRIEPAELFRVYPPLPEGADAPVQSRDDETSRTIATDERNGLIISDNGSSVAVKELEFLKRQLSQEREERARERRQLEDTVSDLRRRLDASEEERRQKDSQLTHLLTDQREKNDNPPPPRGLLQRLFGG
jgi:septal ring factor EnvC (AmiA/AmiB activator)